jgi:hypothetical protein
LVGLNIGLVGHKEAFIEKMGVKAGILALFIQKPIKINRKLLKIDQNR